MILNGDQYPPANIGLPTFISQTVIHGVFYTKLRNRERIYSDLFQSKNNAGQKKFTKKIHKKNSRLLAGKLPVFRWIFFDSGSKW